MSDRDLPPDGPPGPLSAGRGMIDVSPVRTSGVNDALKKVAKLPAVDEATESALDPFTPPDIEHPMMCPACEHGIDCHSLGDPCGALTSRGPCPCAWTPGHIADYAGRGPTVTATLVKVGTNYGDHAQDVIVSVAIDPTETVAAFATRLLKKRWISPREKVPEYEWRIELRMVQPVDGEDF